MLASKRGPTCQEQESLLAAYDDANRDAAHQVKVLEARQREREAEVLDERRAVEAQQDKNADTAQKLRCEGHSSASACRNTR